MDNDFDIFKGKKFSDLCKDIYKNSNEKKNQIEILIGELRTLITGVNEAIIVVPLIAEYLNIGVRNDEALIKLAAVVQRFVNGLATAGAEGGNGGLLSEEDKKQLLDAIEKEAKTLSGKMPGITKQLNDLEIKTETVVEEIELKKE